MDVSGFGHGLLIGVSVAAPVGPMSMLCIRRTLISGRRIGLATGLGVATSDAIYAAIAGFGITVVASVLLRERVWIQLIGGVFLCYLGLKTVLAPAAGDTGDDTPVQPIQAYGSAIGLTLANPPTILSFMGIFAGLGVGKGSSSAPVLVLGVLCGSAFWWLTLCNGIALLRENVTPRMLRWANRTSGCILLGFGVGALLALR